jgi:PadR family transcriptional regulator PadR
MPGTQRQKCRWGQFRQSALFVEPALLLLLHQSPAHGYTLVERLEMFGIEDPHPRVVYRILRDMEDNGWVTSVWDTEQTQGPPRRVYQVTALGGEMLNMCIRYLRQTRAQITELVDGYLQLVQEGQVEYC